MDINKLSYKLVDIRIRALSTAIEYLENLLAHANDEDMKEDLEVLKDLRHYHTQRKNTLIANIKDEMRGFNKTNNLSATIHRLIDKEGYDIVLCNNNNNKELASITITNPDIRFAKQKVVNIAFRLGYIGHWKWDYEMR